MDLRKIPRISKEDIAKPVCAHTDEDEMGIMTYTGKSDPAPLPLPPTDLPNEFLKRQEACIKLAQDLDFEFLRDIATENFVPEYNGYMTERCRERGVAIQPMSVVEYQPLINAKPSDPSTVLTSMLQAKQVADTHAQKYVVMTGDLQIYRVMVQITWDDLEIFSSFFLRLGGMHLLMSFVGCMGTLLEDTGIEDIIDVAFSGRSKIMSGKKFPDCIKAFSMVTEEVRHPVFELPENLCPKSMSQLLQYLDQLSTNSRTTKLWRSTFLLQVITIMPGMLSTTDTLLK